MVIGHMLRDTERDPPATLAVDSRCELGEGVLWDHDRNLLLWTDVQAARLWVHSPLAAESWWLPMPARLGSFALCANGDLLLGLEIGGSNRRRVLLPCGEVGPDSDLRSFASLDAASTIPRRSAILGRPKLEGLMKTAPLILFGWFAIAMALPATPAQTEYSYEDPVWVTTKDVEVVIAEMRSRIEQGRLIEPVGDSALDILRALRDQKVDGPEVQELTRELFEVLLKKGNLAMRALAFERSAQLLRAAREVGAIFDDPALERAESELSTTRKQYPDPYIVH